MWRYSHFKKWIDDGCPEHIAEKVLSLDLEAGKLEIPLISIPDSICKLINLQILILRGNLISILPESIKNLTKLEELDLCDNRIRTIPEAISNLKMLLIDFL